MPEQKNTKKKSVKSKPNNEAKSAAATAGKKTLKKAVHRDFPVVGLGASAGGLNALKSFFGKVAPDSGMGYIVVVHLTPRQPSLMAELLQKVTAIPVETARDGLAIAPDHIYVNPPDKEIGVYHGKIQLLDVIAKHPALPIDAFLRSLALERGARAAAVILSGTGTDGTLGIKEIKAGDGLVLVQSEDSAEYDGMPRSAINSGVVDMMLPPDQMPQKIARYFAPGKAAFEPEALAAEDKKDWLAKVFAILRTKVGHDFSQYKVNTLLRRIGRRMNLNQIDDHDLYVRFLRETPAEVEALFRELLIGVTSFFRDPESFASLKSNVLPALFDRIPEDGTLRAWVPGCSTGEEVYSLAMIMREVLDKNPKRIDLQLFGTDIDSFAIDKARAGIYPASIAADVGKERLKRFFTEEGDHYHIRKEIRDCAVFSVQDLIQDPPFSRLHLLCCRNLLIYLDSQAQKKLVPLFHYTLRPEGVLVLGSSETIGGFTHLYGLLDKKWKIFKRLEVPQELHQQIDFPSGLSKAAEAREEMIYSKPAAKDDNRPNIVHITQKAILDQFAPAAVLVDDKGNIIFIQGRTGKYLENPSGVPTNNILDMARQGLRIELSSALRAARSSRQPEIRRKVGVQTNGDVQMINLHVRPQHTPKALDGRYLVVFEDIENILDASADADARDQSDRESARLVALEQELQNARESRQTTIEELESSNEELKSTNEELQSSNEELQSTNEELESSKEELQSLNEELQTVNSELQSKVEELTGAHDDMRNLLNSTQIATIFVDNDMRIKRFTPEATTIVNLIQSDIGRPLQHVVSNLTYDEMAADLQTVMESLAPKQAEVQTAAGDWYKMRIIPYRTTDNRIDGAVLTFHAINEQKQAQQIILNDSKSDLQQAWQLVRDVFDMHEDPMAVLDDSGKMVIANQAFAEVMGLKNQDIEGTDIMNMPKGRLAETRLDKKLIAAAAAEENFQIDALQITSSGSGDVPFNVIGKKIRTRDGRPYRILLRFEKTD